MAIETGLEGKPWYYSALVALLLVVVIAGAAHYFKFGNMKDQIESRKRQLTALQNQINEGRAAQKIWPQFKEEVEQLELELKRLLRILPSRRNTENLLRNFRALIEQGDFDLLRFTPSNQVPVDFYSEWPIRIQLHGTYHNLALFFDRVNRFARIFNIENLDVRTRPGGGHTVGSSFTAKTFLYNEPVNEDEEL